MQTRELWEIYHAGPVPLLEELASAPAMLRLRGIGMNCGCEYTSFPRFQRLLPYSRHTHSIGVGRIVWHFTGEPAQAAAGLLHDIATPTFAHVVDFLRGDYLTQEATEDGTRELIDADKALQSALRRCGLDTEAVCDYHRYPIADNDAPRLSADRLEYTLGNLLNFGLGGIGEARAFYDDLVAAPNEDGASELVFRHADTALRFAELSLACSEVYVSDEDRYSMQMLSELLRDAVADGVLWEKDLMTEEPALIEKLCRHPHWAERWRQYCGMRRMERSDTPAGEGWRCIDAKRRCIDPLVIGQGRVTELFPAFSARLREFRGRSLAYWVHGRA